MSSNVIQTSFSSGELAPSLFARVDLTKYHTGAALLRNFFVDYRSGASTRPGTRFINQCLISNQPVRVIPFQSSLLVPYIIEFGDGYCRFYSNGTPVLEFAFAITAATQANPCVLTVPGNNFLATQWIFVTGVVGMTQLNGRYFQVASVVGSSVTLNDVNGNPVNSIGFNAYISGGTAQRVFTLPSPYAAADLALLKYVQVTNTMYITHPSYPPTTLVLGASPTNWTFTTISFGTTIIAPSGLSFTATTGTGANFAYIVTAVDANGQESLPSAVLQASNVVNILTTAGTITVSWVPVPGAVSYNVYRTDVSIAGALPAGSAFGFQQSVTGTSFIDSNVVPDSSQGVQISNNYFAAGNNPATCCFFQQRLYYGGSNIDPQTFWASQPGFYNNFNFSDPTQPDDAYSDTLVSKQVNLIKNMLPMPGGLIIFTAQGAWQLSGGGGLASTNAVTPINATAATQTYNGSSDLPPIPINWAVLYPQPDGAVIELNYNIYAAIYTGQDISVLSNHLFFGFTLKEWAYAQKPFRIVWAVRNDGTLLSLTYVKEQEMIGWAHHDTQGLFQSVATVTEGQYDATYVVVKRLIGGNWVQMVERLDDRVTFPYGAEDAWAVDCGVRSTLIPVPANLTISAATGVVTFATDAPVFVGTQPGDVFRAGGGIGTVVSVQTTQIATVNMTQPITAMIPNTTIPLPVAANNWTAARPTTTFTGLDYLNGQTVQILADGNVMPPQQVVAGSITIPQPATKVVAGLGFTKQLQTMYLDLGNEKDTIQGKRKKLNGLTIRVTNTRGLKYGRTFQHLYPIKEMNQTVPMGNPIPLVTGDEYVRMDALWDANGQICLQSDDPLPATVLGVIPEITIGDTPSKP